MVGITYSKKDVETQCKDIKTATKVFGKDIARNLLRRIKELKAFNKFGDIPAGKPWRKEKLVGKNELWSVRINDKYRMEFIILDKDIELSESKRIEIERVSKHYE